MNFPGMLKESGLFENFSSEFMKGRPILIFDHEKREGETDMIFASEKVDFNSIKTLRKDAGGLVCTTIKEGLADILSMPFLEELYKRYLPYGNEASFSGDMRYDSHSSFTFTINSRNTFTGISDKDRSITVNELVGFMKGIGEFKEPVHEFYGKFRIPGHVSLLIAREGYFSKRRGHTELATYLVESCGLFPSATIAEMLADDGNAMKMNEAMDYADKNGLMFIEGKDIIARWADEKGNGIGGF